MPAQKTGQIGTGERPQAMNSFGNRVGVYPDVFTLSMGEFLWKVGLLVTATAIAASNEA